MRNGFREIRLGLLLLLMVLPSALFGFHDQNVSTKMDSLQQEIVKLKMQIQSSPEDGQLHGRLGYLYLQTEGWNEAKTSFEQAILFHHRTAETYNGLGEAFHGKGPSAILPFEAIKRLFRIDNFSRAERQFMRALQIDPDYITPWYNLGRNYLAKGGLDNYEEAVTAFQTVLKKDLLFRDAEFMLGISYQHLRDFVNAELVLRRVVNSGRFMGKALIKLAEIFIETDRNTEATTAYYEGLSRLEDVGTLSDIHAEVEMLMTDAENAEHDSLSIDRRGPFIRQFWNSKDPTPTTDLNERLIEHFRRIQFARENYPDIIPPYYDDRGKVYVKYGPPDAKYISPQYSQGVRENESWSYENSVRKGMTFDFVKSGPSYREVQDLTDAAPTGAGLDTRLAVARRLYFERSDLSGAYSEFGLQQGTLDQSMMARFHSERYEAREEAPVEKYEHVRDEESLDFVYNIAQFRSSRGDSRLELYTGVSNNQLRYEDDPSGVITTTLDYTVIIQDSTYRPVEKRNRQFTLQANTQEEIRNTLFLHQEDFNVPPGAHFVAVLIENPQGNRLGEYRNQIYSIDFSGGSLIMSDVQMASNIQNVDSDGKFIKNGMKITPYPYTVIRKNRPVFMYFEIYNLTFNTQGRTDYTVTHNVEMLEYRKGIFSKIFGAKKQMGVSTSYNQLGTHRDAFEYISLDMSKLPVGLARLTVSVEDRNSDEMTSRNFQVQIIQ